MDTTAIAGKAQGLGLHLLTKFAASDLPDKYHIRDHVEKFLYEGSKAGFKFLSEQTHKNTSKEQHPLTDKQIARKKRALFDLSLTEEQQMMRESLRAFAKEVIYPAAHDADHNHQTPTELLQTGNDMGLIYPAIPENLGGMANDDSTVSQMLALEDLGYGDFGIGMTLFSPVAVANVIRRYGTTGQQQKYLPQLLNDTSPLTATLATNEATPLFNPHKLHTRVKKTGNVYVLTGEKTLVVNAKTAKLFVVSAMFDDKPELFLVDAEHTNIVIKDDPAMGLKPTATCRVRFNGVTLLAKDKLQVNYQQFLDLSRLAVAALACGTAEAVLNYSIAYANEREAFGEPISHRQSVAFMIANLRIELDSVRMLVWRAVARAQNGIAFHREAHLAYILASKKMMEIGTNGVQLLGGHGYTKEHPVERWYRDLRSVAILHGSLCI